MRHRFALLLAALALAGAAVVVTPASAAESPFWASRRVLTIAHAGGDLENPHSTLYAMKKAKAAGADVLEMDVRLSSDGVLMVQHDDTVDRLTPNTGLVSSYTAAQLQAMDNAYWFVPNCWSCHDRDPSEYTLRGIRTGVTPLPSGFSRDDFGIATLQQVVDTFPGQRLNVEIKDGPLGMAGADALAAFIAVNHLTDHIIVASFNDDILDHFHALAPDVALSPGLSRITTWFGTRGPLPGFQALQVPPTYSGIEVVTPQFVADAHAAGLAVWVWFNGEGDDVPAVWQQLIADGVDALLTGHPAAAEQYAAAASVTTTTTTSTTVAATTTTTAVPAVAGSGLAKTGATPWVPAALGAALVAAGAVLVTNGRRARRTA